ncbi:very short patch repair endonuclease [Streptacidiphilus sp. PB12-B1b]|uniref:very short patch repair endonuclease n=1 Tax=Streptacidiphilus sp. PB12-B1b TaxID=2705012 RepID=UPI0015FE1D00|nr:very short patch repair endonuclease [Streptacidiphilus sp. PB12-B1b]QMU79828.1 very short patch repair endonuclease [Streptacidiphilus sp. PB12-B1b]
MAHSSDPTALQPPTPGRSRNMAAIKRRDTKPEREIRSLLHGAGKRYRVDVRLDLDGVRPRPDILFTRAKVAVFVDGCFWHCCPEHGRQPGVNGQYWGPKLERNVARDRAADEALTAAGWTVVRVWEHEVPTEATWRIIRALDTKSESAPPKLRPTSE